MYTYIYYISSGVGCGASSGSADQSWIGVPRAHTTGSRRIFLGNISPFLALCPAAIASPNHQHSRAHTQTIGGASYIKTHRLCIAAYRT